MTTRGRRIAAALVVVAALLFVGRWLALFLADRWWAASVAPAAVLVLTRRALLELGLDLAGMVLSVLWFTAHAQVVSSAIRAVPLRDGGGNSAFRAAMEKPDGRTVLLVGGAALGILFGSGLGTWADTVTLAGQTVQVGLADPALGQDAGWYLSRLPLWLRAQAFVTIIVLVTFGLVLLLYMLGGAIRVVRVLGISDEARLHLGLLLALLAVTVGTSQILAPFELAAGLPVRVASGVVDLHRSVAFVLVGVSVAVAVLSIIWALRPLHSLVAGAWLAFSAALVGAFYLLPDSPPDDSPDSRSLEREFERIAYGLTLTAPIPEPERPVPSFWDAAALAGLGGEDSAAAGAASRGRFITGEGMDRPVWVTLMEEPDSVGVVLVADDTTAANGAPLRWRSSAPLLEPAADPLFRVGTQAARPAAPAVAIGTGPGVPAGGFLRRLVLTWARQAPAILGAAPDARIGWLLAPEDRLRRLAPFAQWRNLRPWIQQNRLQWIADGYVLAESFPVARRVRWEARQIAYARAGLVGVVDASSGSARIFVRPGADHLSRAWAASATPLIQSAEQLPDTLARVLAYPETLLSIQAELFARQRASASGDTAAAAAAAPRVVPGGRVGTWVAPIVDRRTGRIDLLLEGAWDGRQDRLSQYAADTTSAPEAPEVLTRRWQRFSLFQQLRDSVSAGGSSFETGVVRYAQLQDGLIAYQPVWAIDRGGAPAMVLVTVANGERLGAGRSFAEAWSSSLGELSGLLRLSDDSAARVEALRWLREADSALRRGDLVGFGRAFAALKSVLERDESPRPK
jgi:hypothetical protein